MCRNVCAAGLCVIAIGAMALGLNASKKVSASSAQQTKTPNRSADESAIQANIEQFSKAFNAGDAKAIAALFSPGGQVESKDGLIAQGREEIAKVFEQIFKEDGKIKIEVSVESIRFIDTDLAVETGTTKTTSPLDDTPEYDRYTCVHVKRDGKWQMSLARDEEGAEPTAQERLQSLAWLVGDWIDESPEATVMTSCKWSDDKHFLMQDIQVKTGGKPVMMIQQRIGWDPLQKCIHSWVFDSVGGFGEGLWTRSDDGWVIKATGVRTDGTTGSSTNIVTPNGKNGYLWQSTNRVVGGHVENDVEVRVVRKPPTSGGKN